MRFQVCNPDDLIASNRLFSRSNVLLGGVYDSLND